MKLSKQATEILEQLQKDGSASVLQLENKGYDQSMVNRAALELQEEGLVEIQEEEEFNRFLTEKGKKVTEKGSPEHRLIQKLEDGSREISSLQIEGKDIAIGKARQKGWIDIEQGEIVITDDGRSNLGTDPLKQRLKDRDFTEDDQDRGLVAVETSTERMITLTEEGDSAGIDDVVEEFNVEARTKTPRTGKKHFYKEVLDYAREKFVEMGFEEISGDFVVPSVFNFDALNTPQDHPARQLHDTFFLDKPEKTDLSDIEEKVDNIKQTHENGWTTGSKGWGYDWSEEEAAKNVLRTHTTAATAKKLHEIDINQEELPRKVFIIGRVFRNETVDRSHLPGFIQLDGIVIGEDVNFRNLKGYLTEFFEKMGYSEIRLIPSYYPYTEMSVEIQGYDEEEEEWVGLGGSGMFRPEVVKPLLGFEAKVLAWGLGVGRIAMKAAGKEDIRELYRNNLETLEQTPVWRPEKGGER